MRIISNSTKFSASLTILALLAALCVMLAACSPDADDGTKEEEILNFHIKASQSTEYPINGDSALIRFFCLCKQYCEYRAGLLHGWE